MGTNMKHEDLNEVNTECNAFPYQSDAARYHQSDFWKRADGLGDDCEDYGLAKLIRLHARGWPISALRLACCYTEPYEIDDVETGKRRWAKMDERYHAVLEVMTENGPRILDNRQDHPCTLEELQRIEPEGYQPDRIQREGGSMKWAKWEWGE